MNTKTNLDQELFNSLSSLKNDERVKPSVLYKENTKVRLMNLITDEEKSPGSSSSFVFIRNPKFAFRFAGIFLIILVFISSGTILAAQSANPKNSLYPVKLASEDIALKLSPTPFKADVAVEIAKRRGDEITSQQKTDSKPEIKQGIEKYKESIDRAKVFVPSSNTHLNIELKTEEGNLDELTHQYEDSRSDENKTNTEEKVKGTSDFKPQQIQQNTEQKNEEQKIQESPRATETTSSQTIEKSLEETKTNVENEIQKAISPQPPAENK